MQPRSSTSRVLRWPDEQAVADALRTWTANLVQADSRIRRVGYIGSYARGDWAPGSDLDVLLILSDAPAERFRRALDFDATSFPVPVDLIVLTQDELDLMQKQRTRMGVTVLREARWVYESED